MTNISNTDDLIDSRDVIARIEELSVLRQPGPVHISDENDYTDQDSLFAELATLEALAAEGANSAPDWTHGVALIRDSYFETYAQDFARDIGALKDDGNWPYGYIDWARAAEALQMDYTSIDFDGVTYWVR